MFLYIEWKIDLDITNKIRIINITLEPDLNMIYTDSKEIYFVKSIYRNYGFDSEKIYYSKIKIGYGNWNLNKTNDILTHKINILVEISYNEQIQCEQISWWACESNFALTRLVKKICYSKLFYDARIGSSLQSLYAYESELSQIVRDLYRSKYIYCNNENTGATIFLSVSDFSVGNKIILE